MSRHSLVAILTLAALALPTEASAAWVDCEMTFDLAGWAIFYKEAEGSGVVQCSNGERASVTIESKGGGLAFGRSEIVGGKGRFSRVKNMSEIFGTYARAETQAGAGDAAGAQVLTRGDVSLALSGTGRGVEISFALGSFTIRRN
jgi:hypothetical protein